MRRARASLDDSSADVELLAPQTGVWGPTDGDLLLDDESGLGGDAAFDDEVPRPRWVVGAAVAAIAALLAVGVVAAAPWADDPAAVPPTSTAPVSSTPGSGPGVFTGDAPGFVVDPAPSGYEVASATSDLGLASQDTGWGEVWAAEGATRTTGTWFSIVLLPFRAADRTGDPIDLGGRTGWITTGIDGVSVLQFDAGQTDAERVIVISAHGFDRERLAALAASISIVDDRPQLADDRPSFDDPTLLEGLTRLAARSTDRDLLDRDLLVARPRSATLYRHAGNGGAFLIEEIDPGRRLPELAALSATRIPSLPDGWGVSPEFRGQGLVLGNRLLDGRSVRVASWLTDEGATEVVVLSTLDLDEFLLQLHHVRRAGADEWAAALSPDRPRSIDTPGYVVGSDRTEWEVTSAVSPTSSDARSPNGTFELWSTPGASRREGAWVAVRTPVNPVFDDAPGAIRFDVGGGDTAVVRTDDDGVVTLSLGSFDQGIEITSYGWALADLVALAATYPAPGDHPLDVAGIRPDHALVMARRGAGDGLPWEVFGGETAITELRRPSDDARVTVVVQAEDATVDALIPFVIGAPDAVAAPWVTGPWRSIESRVAFGTRVTTYSTLEPAELGAVADALQRADPDEWGALQRLPPPTFEPPQVRPETIAQGNTASGVYWNVQVDGLATRTAFVDFQITDRTAGIKRLVSLDQQLTVGQTGPATIAVWRFGPDDAPRATTVVVTGDGWERRVPLVALGGPSATRVAALVYSELGGFSWGLVDATGTLLSPISHGA